MKHGSLFSGIGGFDLAAQWMGWENVFQIEIDKFCQKVLEKNFPNVKRYGDIKEFDGTEYSGQLDILTGGFPCQSFSIAGKGAVDLILWKEMYRAITEIKPAYVVAENVPGIISRKNAMAFNTVCSDLEAIGYEVTPLNLPVAGKGAPHERERIWFVAYSNHFRCDNEQEENRQTLCNGKRNGAIKEQSRREQQCRISEPDTDVANPNYASTSRQQQNGGEVLSLTESEGLNGNYWKEHWIDIAARLCRVDDGIPNRVDRLRGGGNSISPQVAYEIFKAIKATA